MNESQITLVTGANGFVGSAVVARLVRDGAAVRAATRRAVDSTPFGAQAITVGDLNHSADWEPALAGVDTVVHCAARVHKLRDDSADPLTAFRSVNVDGTMALARQAASSGVRRFIFISSIGVNGAETFDRPFSNDTPPAPHSPYAQSKLEAEKALWKLAAETGLGVVVLRPPLVYGPDAPGNFRALLRAVDRGLPLPFGSIDNRRSFVALDNLVDLIALALHHVAAPGKTFLVSDDDDLSTSKLLRATARALGRPSRLLPMPAAWLRAAFNLAGRSELGQRLCGSLQVDIAATRSILGWSPPATVDEVLDATARRYREQQGRTSR